MIKLFWGNNELEAKLCIEVHGRLSQRILQSFGWEFRQFSFDKDKWLVTLKLSTLKGKILFGMLNDMLSDFSAKFGMKHEFFLLNASCEGLLVKFLVPYLRKLKQAEVLHKLIIVESEYKDYFPPPMVEFTLCNSGVYKVHVDYQGRIRSVEWFNQQKPKVGDIISLWRYGESNEYAIQTLKKEPC